MSDLTDPVIVARSGDDLLLMRRDEAALRRSNADAQLFTPARGEFSPIQPLRVWIKFLPRVEVVEPPQPFDRDAVMAAHWRSITL